MSGPWEKYQSASAGPWAKYQAQASAPPAQPETYDPTEGMTALQKFMAGTGKAFVDLGRGAGQLVGKVSNEDVAAARALEAPLMATSAGKFGNFAGNVAAAAPAAFVPGANTVAGAGVIGAGLGLLQPVESGRERAINTGLGLVAGAVGQKAGQVIGKKLGGAITKRATAAADEKAANAVRDQTLNEARRVGYVVPPAVRNQASKVAVATESLSGKAATQQAAAFRNQKVTDRLIREEFGLSKRADLTPKVFEQIRKQGGKVYEAVSKSGRVVPDQQYLDEIASLSNVLDDVANEFPGASAPSAAKIQELAESLFQQDFDAGAAVKYTRMLREQAKANFKSVNAAGGDAEKLALARAQREAAGALEDMTIRHLRSTGRGGLANAFEKARVTIAKSHDAETALNEATGHIDARKLGGMLRKGKPLGGNFELIAKFAEAAPESARQINTGPGVSALSAVLSTAAGASGLASGNPALLVAAGVPMARSAARAGILSGVGQRLAVPSYAPRNALLQLMQQVAPLSAPIGIGIANTEQ